MFGTLGGPELFLIFVVALIIFGPRKLPEIGKSLGRMMGEFRKASNEFRSTIENEVEAEKIRDALRLEPPAVVPGAPFAPPAATAAADSPAAPPAASTPAAVSRQPETGERVLDVQPIEPR